MTRLVWRIRPVITFPPNCSIFEIKTTSLCTFVSFLGSIICPFHEIDRSGWMKLKNKCPCVFRWPPSPTAQNTVSSRSSTAVRSPDCSTLQVKAGDDVFISDGQNVCSHLGSSVWGYVTEGGRTQVKRNIWINEALKIQTNIKMTWIIWRGHGQILNLANTEAALVACCHTAPHSSTLSSLKPRSWETAGSVLVWRKYVRAKKEKNVWKWWLTAMDQPINLCSVYVNGHVMCVFRCVSLS